MSKGLVLVTFRNFMLRKHYLLISDTQRIVKRAYMSYFPRFKEFLIRNCEIRLEALLYLSVRSLTLPHGEIRLPSDGFA